MPRRLLSASLLFLTSSLLAQTAPSPWQMETSGTTAGLRGIHSAGNGVVWASGTNGTVLRTEDSGYMWQSCAMPPGAEKLDFRAVWAWDANTAIVMSIGPGDQSRLYNTTDGCSHWTLLYTNPDKDGFWDAMFFDSREKGRLLGDPVGGRFVYLTTLDGGKHWQRSDSPDLTTGGSAKGAFAASNSSLDRGTLFGTGGGYIYKQIATGIPAAAAGPPGAPPAEHWQRTKTPLAQQGESSGIFSLVDNASDAAEQNYTLLAVGGDYSRPREREAVAAWSRDGGDHWTLSALPPGGYRSAVAWDSDHKLWITVGPTGSDFSRDDGRTWQAMEYAPGDVSKAGEWNALSLPWAVGPNGRIAKLNAEALPKSARSPTSQ